MTVFVAPIGQGLGDLVVSLPVVQALVATGEPTVLVLRSDRHAGFESMIPGLSGAVWEVDFDEHNLPPGSRFINLRAHPLQKDHLWGSPEFETKFPGWRIMDIMAAICKDFGIKADFVKPQPLPFRQQLSAKDRVLFIPGSQARFKCWPTERWLELASNLTASGESVGVIGQPDISSETSELLESGLQWIPTPTLSDALSAISCAKAIVSVDTGLMHLGLHQGVAAAVMWVDNPSSVCFFRRAESCFSVMSPRCARECIDQELGVPNNLTLKWDDPTSPQSRLCLAPAERKCVSNISVEAVLNCVTLALEFEQRKGTAVKRA